MTTVAACRLCLALNTRLYSIANTPLQSIYEKMTNILLQNEDGKPVMACYICRYLLMKCQTFIETSVKADTLLMEILSTGVQITEKSISMISAGFLASPLTLSVTDNLVFDVHTAVPAEVPVKIEGMEMKKEEIEVEVHHEVKDEGVVETGDFPQSDTNNASSSESEDEIPLQTIKARNLLKVTTGSVATGKIKADVSEVILTKEEQIEQMMKRSKSLNYINSPYKCNFCYKGFIDEKAFKNHNEKHDEHSGAHECDVCRLRYRSARQLRTHAVTAHSRHFLCNKCGHLLHTLNQAREHEKWHIGHLYECQLCGQAFRKSTSYLTHLRKRHPTEHVCELCGDGFVGRHGLLMHKSKAHWRDEEVDAEPSKPAVCTECDITFASDAAWRRHVMTSARHEGGTRAVHCVVCGAVMRASALRAHVRTNHATRRTAPQPVVADVAWPCDQCGKTYANRWKLLSHMRSVHLGLKYNKNVVCEVCGKKFTSNAALKYHQRTHTGEKPFQCASCAKRFADRNQLRIHARTHTGERPYTCHSCPKRFSQKPALNRHYRVHTGAKPYSCQLCPKTFSQSNSLKLHVNAVHLKLPQNRKKNLPTTKPAKDDV